MSALVSAGFGTNSTAPFATSMNTGSIWSSTGSSSRTTPGAKEDDRTNASAALREKSLACNQKTRRQSNCPHENNQK
jgi:hypothetical protein